MPHENFVTTTRGLHRAALPAALQRLRLNPSPAAQVEAAVTYKQNVPQVPLQ
jgi:hypothetical protein